MPLIALIAFFAMISMSACKVEVNDDSKSPRVTKNIAATGFDEIELSFPGNVHFTQSDKYKVTVKAREKTLERMDIKVKGHTLIIGAKERKKRHFFSINNEENMEDIIIYVEAPQLTSVEIAGSGDFDCKGTIKAEKLKLSVAGSGEIDIHEIVAKKVSADIAGSGEIDACLTGVENTSIQIAGSGDVDFELHQCGNVSAQIAGSGDIDLEGDIKTLSQSVAGSGKIDVKKLNVSN